MQYPAQALGLLLSEVLMDLDGQDTSREVALFVGFACTISVFFFPETIDEDRKAQVADDLHEAKQQRFIRREQSNQQHLGQIAQKASYPMARYACAGGTEIEFLFLIYDYSKNTC